VGEPAGHLWQFLGLIVMIVRQILFKKNNVTARYKKKYRKPDIVI
jgi:hypothetical protein